MEADSMFQALRNEESICLPRVLDRQKKKTMVSARARLRKLLDRGVPRNGDPLRILAAQFLVAEVSVEAAGLPSKPWICASGTSVEEAG